MPRTEGRSQIQIDNTESPSIAKESELEQRHFTISEVAEMWSLSEEFVRQLVRGEAGVTEWVRQAPGKRRYRVLRIPQCVVERLYRRAQERHEQNAAPVRTIAKRRW